MKKYFRGILKNQKFLFITQARNMSPCIKAYKSLSHVPVCDFAASVQLRYRAGQAQTTKLNDTFLFVAT